MPVFVNRVEITDDDIHAEMQYHPAASVDGARHKAAQALVIRQLLLQAAKEKNLLEPSSNVDIDDIEKADKTIDLLIKQEVSIPQADKESCERYYRQNLERFIDKKTNQPLSFESVMPYIRDYLYASSLRTGISQYIKLLAGRARIVGFELEGSDTPLQQ